MALSRAPNTVLLSVLLSVVSREPHREAEWALETLLTALMVLPFMAGLEPSSSLCSCHYMPPHGGQASHMVLAQFTSIATENVTGFKESSLSTPMGLGLESQHKKPTGFLPLGPLGPDK